MAKSKKQNKPSEIKMDLPEVKDIPGQEHIRPPKLEGFNDTTISSADEEGVGIPGLDDSAEETGENNVTEIEREMLRKSASTMGNEEEERLARALPDPRDEDGELLNESAGFSGKDLDIPGTEADDDAEDIGEEDEENNLYSLGGPGKD